MKSTSPVAASIQAVLAGSIFIAFLPRMNRRELTSARRGNVQRVEAEMRGRAIGEPALQRQPHGAEGKVGPGNFRLLEEAHLEGLLAGGEVEVEQARAV